MLQFLMDNYAVIITVLFVLSEVLGGIPSIAASSVYQLVFGLLKTLKEKFVPAKSQ